MRSAKELELQERLNRLESEIKLCINLNNLDLVRKELKYVEKQVFVLLKTLQNKEVSENFNCLLKKIKKTLLNKRSKIEEEIIYKRLIEEESNSYVRKFPVHKQYNQLSEGLGRAYNIMKSMGYSYYDSQLLVTNEENFDFLGIDKNHPLREEAVGINDYVLRSHTTSFQCKFFKEIRSEKEDFKVFTVGKVFRDDYDKTHFPCFHQLDVFEVHNACNVNYLMGVIKTFLVRFFEKSNVNINIKMSNFPFTSPSFEIYLNDLEIAGCGIIHPRISQETGIALGIGIDRLVMIKEDIKDIRLFWRE